MNPFRISQCPDIPGPPFPLNSSHSVSSRTANYATSKVALCTIGAPMKPHARRGVTIYKSLIRVLCIINSEALGTRNQLYSSYPFVLLAGPVCRFLPYVKARGMPLSRSEEHTSELQSRLHLVCRLLF